MIKGFLIILGISVQIALIAWVIKLHILVVSLGKIVLGLVELVRQLNVAL